MQANKTADNQYLIPLIDGTIENIDITDGILLTTSEFVSQEDIDSVLQRGSGFQNGKYRIYRQFQKNEDGKSNIDFLKKEYGTGGGTHYFPDGTQGHTWHDGKGIAIEKYGSSVTPDLVLSWAKVEKRLRELIKNDRYLNEKEKDHYADYLESEEAPQYEIDTQRKMARQRFIDANRDLPPADKRDTLALRLSDFIRDLDNYEKDLLENVERTDLADVTAEQMEQHLGDPATVQQLIDFLRIRLSFECLHRLTDEETEYLLVARAVLRNVLFASGKHVGKNLLISGIIADDFQSMRLDIAFDVLPAVKGIGKHLSCALAAESACGNSGDNRAQSLSA